MIPLSTNIISSAIRRNASLILGQTEDYNALANLVDDVDIVLLGEASHGTSEFYHERATITKLLITQYGFNAIAIEGDWPDAYRVNQYVKGQLNDITAKQSLDGFRRFPTWMWCNREVLSFVEWLHYHNHQLSSEKQVGFYGLDLYSMHASMDAVVKYLNKIDPEAAIRARQRYACFDHFGINPQNYAYATSFGAAEACEQEVIQQLHDLRSKSNEYQQNDGRLAADEYFFAEQNAKLVKNVEKYYRLMFNRDVSSWNLRDRHMVDTLEALDKHLTSQNGKAKIVVWAHNSHVGDARATEMGARGEYNIGQLVREHYGKWAVNIGFTTYTGTVTAASDWDEPGQRRRVRPALPGSYESLLHDVEIPAYLLKFDGHDPSNQDLVTELLTPRLERAIGVVYRPETERLSHYFLASLPEQFDAVIHIDETQAVEPLDLTEHWQVDEEPETYPFGI
ncbi:erythromycin esterase [mine drainage metagenome]|uniref:Erythromycin esterase n=1 Tax=mine drainage metagenome TaxID=410659 RepID=A0A1J5T9Q7_9ZZZZ